MSSNDARAKALTNARAMLSGTLSLVEGCRDMVRLLGELDPELAESEAALTFVAVESETDEYPVGEARTQWNSEALRKRDAELQTYVQSVNMSSSMLAENSNGGCPRGDAREGQEASGRFAGMKVADLENCVAILTRLARERGVDDIVPPDSDLYWTITAPEWTRVYQQPKPAVGSFSDDDQELTKMLANRIARRP